LFQKVLCLVEVDIEPVIFLDLLLDSRDLFNQ